MSFTIRRGPRIRDIDENQPRKLSSIRKLRVFIPFIYPYRLWLIFGIFALILTAMMSLILPVLIGEIFDVLTVEELVLSPRIFLIAIGVALVMAAGVYMRVYFIQNLAHRLIADIREAVFGHIIGLSRRFFDNIKSGEIVSRLSGDATVVGTVLTNNMSMATRHLLTFTGGLIMMFYTSPLLTGLVLLIVPIIIIPMAIISRKLIRYARAAQDALAEGTAHAAEAIQSAVTVQSYAQEDVIKVKYDERTEAHYQAHRKRIKMFAALLCFMILLMLVAVIAVLWVGASQVKNGEISGGTLVQFLIYSMMVGGGAQSFSGIWSELMRAVGAGERLAELLSAEESLPLGQKELAPKKGAPMIRVEKLSFAYPSQPEQIVLNNLSFTLKKGKTLALVGPSGAGKSTILQLLLRHYDAKGKIEFMGQDIREVKLQELRSQFAYVEQEAAIFAMSIKENIAFSRPDASDAEIHEAAKAAYADEFIERLADGYESYVGERGVLLSGGQKARIALARAFLSDAPILLLDEATAALDAESEHYVQKAVERLHQERTVIAIAHRLATVQRADEIILLDRGIVVNKGTHQSLLKSSPLYARLAKMQFLSN